MRVKITRTAISPVHGNMGPGDILDVSDAFAKHLVEEAKCAVYLTAPEQKEAPAAGPAAPAPKAAKAKKAK